MLARIGPVKPVWSKRLIAHSEACGRAEDGPPTRSRALALRRRRRIGGEPMPPVTVPCIGTSSNR
jgi:hypothetical protein